MAQRIEGTISCTAECFSKVFPFDFPVRLQKYKIVVGMSFALTV
jgi:hypothetical protein